MLVKSRNAREKSGQILLEGKRLIIDAIKAGATLQTIFFSDTDNLKDVAEVKNLDSVPLYKIVYKHLKVWSDLTTCPGIMGKESHFNKINENTATTDLQQSLRVCPTCVYLFCGPLKCQLPNALLGAQ